MRVRKFRPAPPTPVTYEEAAAAVSDEDARLLQQHYSGSAGRPKPGKPAQPSYAKAVILARKLCPNVGRPWDIPLVVIVTNRFLNWGRDEPS